MLSFCFGFRGRFTVQSRKRPFGFQCRVGVNHRIQVAGAGYGPTSVEAHAPALTNLPLVVCSSLQVTHTRYTLHHWPGALRKSQGMVTQCGGECCTWGTRFQGGDIIERDLSVRGREVLTSLGDQGDPGFAANARLLLWSLDAVFLRLGGWPSRLALHATSRPPHALSLICWCFSAAAQTWAPSLDCSPTPVPLRDLRFTGSLGSITSSHVCPLFLVLILGCEVTRGTSLQPHLPSDSGDAASPWLVLCPDFVFLFQMPFRPSWASRHLLPESLHLLLGAHPTPTSAAPGFGLSSLQHEPTF